LENRCKILTKYFSFIKEDIFNFHVFLLLLCGVLNILTFPLDLPFPVLYGGILYSIHQENFLQSGSKKYVNYSIVLFILFLTWRLFLFADIAVFEEGYYLFFSMIAGASLIYFPFKIYLDYRRQGYNEYTERIILVNQLSIISVLCGLTTILLLGNRIYPVDFDVSPFHLIFILITLTLILKSIYLYKEWKGTCEEGMKEEAKDLEEKISENEIAQYEKILRAAMQEKLLFLRADFSLERLSVETGLPKYKLSQYLNQHLRKTFYQYIAEYRIHYAVESMDAKKENYTIEAMAFACGFNSVTTFNKYFREFIGCSPKEYRSKVKRR